MPDVERRRPTGRKTEGGRGRGRRDVPQEGEDYFPDIPARVGELPVVAIVGRPNVGKSALFNRLVGEPISIVEDEPGVTRDRIYAETTWNGRTFILVDTGGMIITDAEEMSRKSGASLKIDASMREESLRSAILEHARQAVEESELVIFLVDTRAGIHALEEDIADLLRKSGRPVMLVANKVDNLSREVEIHEFHGLGLGEPWPVSALHGLGTGDLLDEVAARLPETMDIPAEGAVRLAIVGRPNVGKSSLLNQLLGEERAIVDSVPGTTRDPVDTFLRVGDDRYVLVDTAGIRRRARMEDRVEFFSAVRSERAIKKCDIALLLLDGSEGVIAQDKRVAGVVQEARKAIVVVVNKWDIVTNQRSDEEARREFARELFAEMSFMTFAPVIFLSAKTGRGTEQIFDVAKDVYEEFSRRIETSQLNRVIQEAFMMRPPPTYKGEQLKVYYAHQRGSKPPTFVLQVNNTKLLHFSYRRYLENHIRRAFGLVGTPIDLVLRPR